jgi:hypothetical protein
MPVAMLGFFVTPYDVEAKITLEKPAKNILIGFDIG